MRYAKIKKNDIANGPGIAVSFFVQGCHRHCMNCFNPETWDFDGGEEFTQNTMNEILDALVENNVPRHLAILGGEPLCEENLFLTRLVISTVKEHYPNTPIYLWTGYTFNELEHRDNPHLKDILGHVDVLVDGPYIDSERDITLPMRGSRNQRIINLREGVLRRASEQD